MPKIVDPRERREQVAGAAFRVIARSGLAGASLRNVAEEAGLAVGSVRHYFAGHDELLVFTFRSLIDAISGRLREHADRALNHPANAAQRRRQVEQLLAEMLPLDEQRRLETLVWLAFQAEARRDERLRPYARELADGLRSLVDTILRRGAEAGRLDPARDIQLEADRLCALIDGLALTVVSTPELLSGPRALTVLRAHLDSLARR